MRIPSRSFKTINKSIIKVREEFSTELQLAVFSNKTFKVTYNVLEDDNLFVNMILDCDFLQAHKIVIVCEVFGGKKTSKLQLFFEIASLKVNNLTFLLI